jgi:DNA-binding MarR family transcriptional regulator
MVQTPAVRDPTAARPPEHVDFDVERSPRYRLALLSRLWTQSTERIYIDQFGISLSEWRILAIIGSEGRIYANAIAERGLLEKSRISRLVSRLVRTGLVETSSDAADSRRQWLSLTDKGRTLYAEVADLSLKRDELFLRGLNTREREELARLTRKLLNWSFTVTGAD